MATETLTSIADGLRRNAADRPEKTATIFGDRETNYRQLDAFCSQVSNGLLAENLKPQDRIAYIGKNSDLGVQLQFGVNKANMVWTPINWRLAAPEIVGIVNHSDARILFVGPEFIDLVAEIRNQLNTVEKVISLDPSPRADASFIDWRSAQSVADPLLESASGDICFQLYTSGTTGVPKGVMLTNGGALGRYAGALTGETELEDWQIQSDDDVSLWVAPNFHLSGNGSSLYSILDGGTLLVHPEFKIEPVLDAIETYKITRCFMVPAMLKFVLDQIKSGEADLRSLRIITYGASPIPPELMKEAVDLIGCGFVQMYGMTEIGASCTILNPEDHLDFDSPRLKSCGKAIAPHEIKICDPETGADLPSGQVGEVVIRTPTLMAGYYKNPEATAKVIRNGWYHSGDAGYLDTDGYLYIVDRLKDMIVSGGENIYCSEVEATIAAHPAVADVAVIGVPSQKWGEEVKALVKLETGATLNDAELLAFTRERLAGYKVPKSVEFRDELPRNPSGKLLKTVLREPYWKNMERRVS